ncbi:unnamed protein product [Discosporangium mesarthrocarpum]
MYTPGAEDVGHSLMVRCTPVASGGRRGRSVVHAITNPVRQGPEPGLLSLRQQWLKDQGSQGGVDEAERKAEGSATSNRGRLRWVCYNILADMFCTSTQAGAVLYPHCPHQYRAASYRLQLVLGEVRGYHADLVFLQECEAKTFNSYFNPLLGHEGFHGLFKNKSGSSPEGVALFFRRSKLRHRSSHDLVLKDAIPAMDEFQPLLDALPHLKSLVEGKLTTVAQVVVLSVEGSPGVRLVVANTHLYFHPQAAHIRVMQLAAIMKRVAEVKRSLVSQGLKAVVLVGGDLNSVPDGPVRYLCGDLITPESGLWAKVASFQWHSCQRYLNMKKNRKEMKKRSWRGDRFFNTEAFEGVNNSPGALGIEAPPPPPASQAGNLGVVAAGSDSDVLMGDGLGNPANLASQSLPLPYLRLEAELVLASGMPPFTNFTPTFTETLDYVFVEKGAVRLLGTAPMPEEDALRAVTPGLPSETFPSDHVSLVGDLQLLVS